MSNEAQRAITHFWFDIFESDREYDGYELAEIAREHFRKLVDYDLLEEIKKREGAFTVVCMICNAETEITADMLWDDVSESGNVILCTCGKALMVTDGVEKVYVSGRKGEDE